MKRAKWLAVVVAIIIDLAALSTGTSSCTMRTAGSHREFYCTVIVQTEKALVQEDGNILLDPRDVTKLDCYEVWVAPEE